MTSVIGSKCIVRPITLGWDARTIKGFVEVGGGVRCSTNITVSTSGEFFYLLFG